MKEALDRIIAAGRWELPLFGGAVLVRGRILSPSEAETAGLSTYLLLAQLAPAKQLSQLADLQKQAEKIQEDGNTDNEMEDFIGLFNQLAISPDALEKMAASQNRLICEVVKSGSIDNGQSWQKLAMVHREEEQNSELGKLWIGMLSKEDRELIIQKALSGHKEAADRIAGFLGTGSPAP